MMTLLYKKTYKQRKPSSSLPRYSERCIASRKMIPITILIMIMSSVQARNDLLNILCVNNFKLPAQSNHPSTKSTSICYHHDHSTKTSSIGNRLSVDEYSFYRNESESSKLFELRMHWSRYANTYTNITRNHDSIGEDFIQCNYLAVSNVDRCRSCVYEQWNNTYSADCTNLQFGRYVLHESIVPFIFPFTEILLENKAAQSISSNVLKSITMDLHRTRSISVHSYIPRKRPTESSSINITKTGNVTSNIFSSRSKHVNRSAPSIQNVTYLRQSFNNTNTLDVSQHELLSSTVSQQDPLDNLRTPTSDIVLNSKNQREKVLMHMRSEPNETATQVSSLQCYNISLESHSNTTEEFEVCAKVLIKDIQLTSRSTNKFLKSIESTYQFGEYVIYRADRNTILFTISFSTQEGDMFMKVNNDATCRSFENKCSIPNAANRTSFTNNKYATPTMLGTNYFAADCTNMKYGRNATCESSSPIFFPFSKQVLSTKSEHNLYF